MYSTNNINIGIVSKRKHFDGGRGTSTNPYRITKIRHFYNIRRYTNLHYKLENDIVFTDEFEPDGEYYNNGSLWIPIGTFSGSIDGQGYKVENIKSIFTVSTNGTFCREQNSPSVIKNIYFKNINVNYSGGGGGTIGGIVGRGSTSALIEGVYVDGFLRAHTTVGGIVGRACKLVRCATDLIIDGNNVVGNLVGGASTAQIIEDCYTKGRQQNLVYHRAGVHGSTYGALIHRTFASTPLGGGNTHLRRGIISAYDGYNGQSHDCYYDTTIMGNISSNNYGTGFTIGLSSTYMKYPYPTYNGSDQAYAGWDFNNIWAHDINGDINNGYPYLRGVTPLNETTIKNLWDYVGILTVGEHIGNDTITYGFIHPDMGVSIGSVNPSPIIINDNEIVIISYIFDTVEEESVISVAFKENSEHQFNGIVEINGNEFIITNSENISVGENPFPNNGQTCSIKIKSL